MGNFFAIYIIFLISILIVEVNSSPSGWSSWTNCRKSESCFRTRIFTCDAGQGIECLNETGGGNFEQTAYYCDTSSNCLENVEEMFYASEVSVLETHPLSLVIELNSPTVSHIRVSKRLDVTPRMSNHSIAEFQNFITAN